jgi:hypothetical protein
MKLYLVYVITVGEISYLLSFLCQWLCRAGLSNGLTVVLDGHSDLISPGSVEVDYKVCSPGWPNWANIRLLGDCLLWADFLKIKKAPISGYLFHAKNNVLFFTKKLTGLNFGQFFQTFRVTPIATESANGRSWLRRRHMYTTLMHICR